MSRRATLRWSLLTIVFAATTGCHDGPFSPYWDRGTYELVAANDRYVPAMVYSAMSGGRQDRVDVLGGSLTLRGDGSYELLVHVAESVDGWTEDVTHAYAGAYDAQGSMLFLRYDVPGSYYSDEMQAMWRNGSVEVVVPDIAMGRAVLLRFWR